MCAARDGARPHWHDDKAPSQHGPAFGRAYHEVWEAYLRYLGLARENEGHRNGSEETNHAVWKWSACKTAGQ